MSPKPKDADQKSAGKMLRWRARAWIVVMWVSACIGIPVC